MEAGSRGSFHRYLDTVEVTGSSPATPTKVPSEYAFPSSVQSLLLPVRPLLSPHRRDGAGGHGAATGSVREVEPDDRLVVDVDDRTQMTTVSAQRDRFRGGAMFGPPLRFAPGGHDTVAGDEAVRETQLQHRRR